MVKAYFLNTQIDTISIELNSGEKHQLAALNDQTVDPFCSLDLKATLDKDVLGTSGINNLSVITKTQAEPIKWTIQMSGILPDNDIQFLVFENCLLARQGSIVEGFIINKNS